jgi:hypothetical protein
MSAVHPTSPFPYRAGKVRSGFGEATFVGIHINGRDAPIPVIHPDPTNRLAPEDDVILKRKPARD